jgi:hypothetical protein
LAVFGDSDKRSQWKGGSTVGGLHRDVEPGRRETLGENTDLSL